VDWSDVLKGALSFFLIVTGLGLGFLMLQMAGVFTKVGSALSRITDEVVPILNKSQTTIDGVNQQLEHVDDIMESAVGATKTTEKAVGSVARAVSAPVRKLAALAAGLEQGVATFRARSAADAASRDAMPPTSMAPPVSTPPGTSTSPPGREEPPGPPRHESPYPSAGGGES
jgi:hypothetical protein